MNSTVLNVKIDKTIKTQAQSLAKQMGLPLSTVVAAGLRDFIRTGSVTFSVEPRLKPEVEQELRQLSRDARQGKNISPAFDSMSDALTWLHGDDD